MGQTETGISAVLFDADGVVQRTSPEWRTSLAGLCADSQRVEAFLADVFAAEKLCLTGAGDFRMALEAVLRRWGSNAPVEDALRIWTLIEPDQHVLAAVRRLRDQGICAALATNQQPYRAAFMTEVLGYAESFDHLFYSCELGHAKPAPDYFAAVVARLAMPPGQVLFLDDHAANVQAAVAAGLAAAVFHLDEGAGRLQRLLEEHGLAAP